MKKISTLLILLVIGFQMQAQTKKTVTTTSKKVVTKKTVIPNNASASIARGKTVYAAHCLSCHQVDGGGVPNLNPPLIQTSWVLGDKRSLIQWVLKGSRGKVEIDGETFHNTMPPQAYLTDQQIADVLTYVRNSFGNKASAVQTLEVTAARAK